MAPTPATDQRRRLADLAAVHPNAAGLDSGSAAIVAAGPPDRDPQPVRVFRTCPPDRLALVDWRIACGIATVALESTGVFWVPIYALLEQHGMPPYLVHARHVKTVPGRTPDGNAGQWLQKLPMLGWRQGSCRPDAAIRAVRALARQRAELIRQRALPSRPMQPARTQMHLRLRVVLSDSTGTTGPARVRAIVAGARDPARLAALRNVNCKATVAESTTALTGTWPDAQRFMLKQAVERFDCSTTPRAAGDQAMARRAPAMAARGAPNAPLPDLPPTKPGSKSKNEPNFNVRAQLARIVGGDLVSVMGIAASSAQTIISEIGPDMSRFPTVKHGCAGLGLAPRNASSGGTVLRSRTMQVRSRANQAFRAAAASVGRSDSALGAY